MNAVARYLVAVAFASSPACDSGASLLDREVVKLGNLAFEVPASWSRSDSTHRGVVTGEWKPADNDRRESVVVTRTALASNVAQAAGSVVEHLLVDAQRSLTNARASSVTPITTARGLTGARLDVDFIRPGTAAKYRRTHVVLVDRGAADAGLVHVLYTAQRPDPERVALNGVLDTIRREEL